MCNVERIAHNDELEDYHLTLQLSAVPPSGKCIASFLWPLIVTHCLLDVLIDNSLLKPL